MTLYLLFDLMGREARGRHEHVVARENVRPALFLRLGRRLEARHEPVADDRMGPGKGRHGDLVI